jgi:hypothetical protein
VSLEQSLDLQADVDRIAPIAEQADLVRYLFDAERRRLPRTSDSDPYFAPLPPRP